MKTKFLILAIIFQIIVLLSLYINTQIPLYFGKEIKVLASPVDPRDMFRGNYVELDYDFSSISGAKNGTIYAVLKKDGEIYVFDKFESSQPDDGVFLKGKIKGYYDVEYGIEAFFMPKNKALETQKIMNNKRSIVTLMVLSNGKAAIKDLTLK